MLLRACARVTISPAALHATLRALDPRWPDPAIVGASALPSPGHRCCRYCLVDRVRLQGRRSLRVFDPTMQCPPLPLHPLLAHHIRLPATPTTVARPLRSVARLRVSAVHLPLPCSHALYPVPPLSDPFYEQIALTRLHTTSRRSRSTILLSPTVRCSVPVVPGKSCACLVHGIGCSSQY